jgi:fatty acyl-CoA reductase
MLSNNYRLSDSVISTWTEPFPGWTDNFNSPVGLMVAAGKGFVRTAFADPNTTADCIPVDICIEFMVLTAWYKADGRLFTQILLYFYQRFHF